MSDLMGIGMAERVAVGHPTLSLRDISPAKHPGFSPNLYRYLKRHGHFYRDGGVLDCAYRVKEGTRLAEFCGAGTVMLGFLDDGDFIGSRMMSVLCNGVGSERFCYPGSAVIIPGFWDQYLKVGRCAIDPEHKEHFVGVDRFDVSGERRVCRWCGAVQRRVVTPRTVFDESWVGA
ncbi:MAG: hypothetical protein KAX55_00290 [Propionivibrio sp.]|nr:hypothetical protein [Propionivibrio sp.]